MDQQFKKKVLVKNILVILICLFLVLTFFVKLNPYFSVDLQVSWFFQQFRQVWFYGLMNLLTQSGNMPKAGLILLGIVGLLIYFDKKKEGIMVLLSTSGVTIFSELIKALIARPRPSANLLLYQLGQYKHHDSYPSGHVLFAIGLYGFLLFLVFLKLKKGLLKNILVTILLLIMILMGVSRIYVGAHWFSDTLGSYLFGSIWLYLMIWVYQKYLNGKA